MHVIAAKAVSFHEALQPEFKIYAEQVVRNAAALADALQKRGFKLISGGTSNHLILIDIKSSFGIHGGIAEKALDDIGLTANKNAIPDDTEPPFRPSGLRLGTPAITTRGLKESDMEKVAEWMLQAIESRDDIEKLSDLHDEVVEFARQFPLPSDK